MLWQDGDVLLPRHRLEEALGAELAKQYRMRRGDGCLYMPVRAGDQYLCTCGTVNPVDEPCRVCGLDPELLDRQVVESLRREAEERLAREDEERARLEAEQREREARLQKQKRKQKIRRLVTAIAAGVAALALGVYGFWAITRIVIPESHYQNGLKALKKGNYQEAHRQFVLAGDHKDAEDYLARFYTPVLSVRSTLGYASELNQYEYDEQGRLMWTSTALLQIDAEGRETASSEPKEYVQTYDEQGNPLVKQDWYGKTVYTYDEKGAVLTEVNYRTDGDESYNKSFTYIYDEQGRVLQRNEICTNLISLNYSYEQSVRYTYDDAGRVASQIQETNYPASVDSSYRSTTQWTYDSQDRPVHMEETIISPYDSENESRQRSSWLYDSQGRQTEYRSVKEYPNDPARNYTHTTRSVYDEQGQLLEERTESQFPNDPDRNSATRRSCVYDWEGRLLKQTESAEYADEERTYYSGYTQTNTYTYDLLGRRVKLVQVWECSQEDQNFVQTESYRYGADGVADRAEIRVETSEGTTESTVLYNDNGLAEKVEYKNRTNSSVNEYTYAYFYYPEGTEKPENSTAMWLLYGI